MESNRNTPSDPLKQLAPTADPLLELVCQNIDDQQLKKIARADYAQDVEQHLNALRLIKNGDIPAPMEWHPREVLELTRWTEPDDHPPDIDAQKIQDHWLRLFACAILIHADVNPKNFKAYHWGSDETIVQLVESATRLGTETSKATLQFLCWCRQQEQIHEEDSWYFALAILSLATTLDNIDTATNDYLLGVLHSDARPLSDWIHQSQRKAKWIQLAEDLNLSL